MNDLQLYADAALAPSGKVALQQLPKQQAMWVGGSVGVAAIAGATPLWAWAPELALCIALGAGAALVNPRRLWAAPLVIAAVAAVGLACGAIGVPPVVGAGATAGALGAWLVPHRTDALDLVNGALGSLTGASLGLWAAVVLLPSTLPSVLLAPLTLGLVALVAAQGLLPVALRFDLGPSLPSRAEVARTLRVPYRPPVMRALELYQQTQASVPERDTRRGLAEMAMWVYRLQQTLQTLDRQLEQIDPEHVEARIRACRELADDVDAFTRERRQATAVHLERLLERRRAIAIERDRTDALVDYSLAYLEEARAGMTVAQQLPGENAPERLDEVLDRLREYAREGDTRRQTAREVDLTR
jgi:hypothetical protein